MYKEKTIVLFIALKTQKVYCFHRLYTSIYVSRNAYKSMGFFF